MFWKETNIWYSKDKPCVLLISHTKTPQKWVAEKILNKILNQYYWQLHLKWEMLHFSTNNKKENYSHIYRVKLFLPGYF